MKEIHEILQVIVSLVTIAAGICAVWIYYLDTKRRRSEWMTSLFVKFYEEAHYKKIRYILDYKPHEYDKLKQAVESGEASERVEQIVDYLNFFEFAGALWRNKQISVKDIRVIFQYYLDNIRSHAWLCQFVQKQGFESLDRLLNEVSRKGKE